jgi:transposase
LAWRSASKIGSAADYGDAVLAPRAMALLRCSIRVWRNCERLARRFGPGVLSAFLWRHGLELNGLLAAPAATKAGVKLRRILLKNRANLFVFLEVDGVSPTNNGSEQSLRPSTVFRKVTNCFRSGRGARLHADVRSAIETARRRGVGTLDAICITLAGQPLPVPP